METDKQKVFAAVKKAILEVLPDLHPEAIGIGNNLKELGANSIDRMEVVTRSMEELQLTIPLMSFAKVSNIQGLVDVLDHHLQPA
jgi:polyketide biosynthesis acyl carrier protein